MTKIVAFSGKMGAGKNTCCNFIVGQAMCSLGIIKGGFKIQPDGNLFITDLFGDDSYTGVFDVNRPGNAMRNFLATHLDKHIKQYSFADLLKREVCMAILGLSYESCYGTNDQKNELTHLLWENMPGIVTPETWWNKINKTSKVQPEDFGLIMHDAGPMTGREVLQYVGTQVFRKIENNVWAKALMRRIKEDEPKVALISDLRFPDEGDETHNNDGLIVRLTRAYESSGNHLSETALDGYEGFDFVIDNSDLSISDLISCLYEILKSVGLIKE